MGAEGEHQIRPVHQEQDERDRDAQRRDRRRAAPEDALKGGGQDEGDRRECEQRRLGTRARRVELLLRLMAKPAREHGGPENKEDVSDDRAGDRGLHHVVQAGVQRDDGDDELGGIAEGRIQEPTDALPRPHRQLLGGAAHPAGERNDGQGRREEDPERLLRREMLESGGERDERDEPARHGHVPHGRPAWHTSANRNSRGRGPTPITGRSLAAGARTV
jgi:hypothetical protein